MIFQLELVTIARKPDWILANEWVWLESQMCLGWLSAVLCPVLITEPNRTTASVCSNKLLDRWWSSGSELVRESVMRMGSRDKGESWFTWRSFVMFVNSVKMYTSVYLCQQSLASRSSLVSVSRLCLFDFAGETWPAFFSLSTSPNLYHDHYT